MVDIAGDSTTTATITVGETITDEIQTVGDHDWFAISLTAGQKISIGVDVVTLEDPYVYIRDANGTILGQNDDDGPGRGSRLVFTVPTTATYYIDVAAWAPTEAIPGYTGTGTYKLYVTDYVAPGVATLDEIAFQMTDGFFDGDRHHFDVTQGGTITVNLTAITDNGRTVALQALQQWSDILGVNFVEQSGAAQITFDDIEQGTGAFADTEHENGITTSAIVNVSVPRINLHTYMHEIGHALGIGHTSNSNAGTVAAVYPDDAIWANDGAAISIMSYFDNGENDYYSDLGFSNLPILTPQVADIIAMGNLYGLSTTTRTGNTTYGFNNDSGRTAFDAALHPNASYTIFDSGGVDTLDYSGFATNQLINLNSEEFCSVGPGVGNVVIARGTLIENAIGGSGADRLIGNSADNVLTGNAGADILTGGAGADSFCGTIAGLNGDLIVDWTGEDRIIFTNATIGAFSFSTSGSTLSFTGGSLTLGTVPAGRIVASPALGGGIGLAIQDVEHIAAMRGVASGDFNGDGRDDILWRNESGQVATWLGQPNGGFESAAVVNAATNWKIVGAGDFDGDGRQDILWREDFGQLASWRGQADGGFATSAGASVSTDWKIIGIGDFNGDGRDDILWRSGKGDVTDWLGGADGAFEGNSANSYYQVPPSWTVVRTGDFNGDGRGDILWRGDSGQTANWLGQANGGFVANAGANLGVEWAAESVGDIDGDGRDDIIWRDASGAVASWLGQENGGFANGSITMDRANWHILGTGDFNGDGRHDILWRSDLGGKVENWLGDGGGGFVSMAAVDPGDDWQVESIGDFNSDGRDDVLWRNGAGDVTNWPGQANGSFADNLGNADYQVADSWSVDGGPIDYGVTEHDARNDFDGDGRSDLLLRNSSGQVMNWLGDADGGFVLNATASAGAEWQIFGSGDFNGDGRDDILWRHASGDITDWLGQADGSFQGNSDNALYSVAAGWNVAGTGDFNGDGRDDILWRHESGQVGNWLGLSSGGFVSNTSAYAGTDWTIAGTGDFNGDGRDDILWRNAGGTVTDWLAQADGSFVGNSDHAYSQVAASWNIAGTGDFNGDGRDDILWRDASGQVANWLGQADGGFVSNAAVNPGSGWNVASIGDFNGDGRDDVLFRNSNGDIGNWLGQPDGAFTSNFDHSFYQLDTSWLVQPNPSGAGLWDY